MSQLDSNRVPSCIRYPHQEAFAKLMQSASDEVGSFGEDWAKLPFDLELTEPTPRPRLPPASVRHRQPTSDRPRLAMTTSNQPFQQSASFESAEGEETKQEATPPRDQHRRGYQACDPCRKRKVKCDLGSQSIWTPSGLLC